MGAAEEYLRAVMEWSASHCSIQGVKMLTSVLKADGVGALMLMVTMVFVSLFSIINLSH